MIEHVVGPLKGPVTLKRYLERGWPLVPARVFERAFEKRDVKVNGVRTPAGATLTGGEAITAYIPEEYSPSPLRVLFDDGKILAVEKPQGLPVCADELGISADTALARVRALFPCASLCHRLDAGTGGVLLFALDERTRTAVEEMFRSHRVRKKYLALVCGSFPPHALTGRIDLPLVKDSLLSRVRAAKDAKRGMEAHTLYRVLHNADPSLVELEPLTGRTHQLRVHMACAAHPILMDDKYGDRLRNRRFSGPIRLWCLRIELPCGPAGSAVAAESGLPEWARGYAP